MLINNDFYSSWFFYILLLPFFCGAVFIFIKRKTTFKSVERFVYLFALAIGFVFLMTFLAVDSTTGNVWIISRGADGAMTKSEKRLMWYASYRLSNGKDVKLHSGNYLLVNDTDIPLKVIPIGLTYANPKLFLQSTDELKNNKKVQNFINDLLVKGTSITAPFSVSEHSYLKYFGYKEEAPKDDVSVSSYSSLNVSSWSWVTY